jgi:hypothetical protein
MKKFLFLLAFLPVLALAQTPPITGCLGLTFGMSQPEAIHQLASKIDTTGIKILDNRNLIVFFNVHFADNFFDILSLSFYEGKLYEMLFDMKSMDVSKLESVFSDLRSSYKTKYNDPFFENDHILKWIDKSHHSSIVIGYIISKETLLLTYKDDEIEKQVSLEKEKDL